MDKTFNPDTARIYHFRYMREYRAVSVLWALLTIIWCILNVVVFIQPQWIGDTAASPGYGHQGVYKYCFPNNARLRYDCSGSFTDFNTVLNDSYRAATFFVGVSALLMLIAAVAALLLFFCFNKKSVFVLTGIIRKLSPCRSSLVSYSSVYSVDQDESALTVYQELHHVSIFLFLACVIYPSGWDNDELQKICGEDSGKYNTGKCNIRWAYILAILGIFDAFILAILAFFLASKRAKIEMYTASGAVTKSELNGFGGDTMSRKSMPIQPAVVAVPGGPGHQTRDSYSDYSQVKRPGSQSGFNL